MGTHISKVKSIDLDIWQPEQLEVGENKSECLSSFGWLTRWYIQSIKQWGNKRANVYWEAHLKPGHIPPDQQVDFLSYLSSILMFNGSPSSPLQQD